MSVHSNCIKVAKWQFNNTCIACVIALVYFSYLHSYNMGKLYPLCHNLMSVLVLTSCFNTLQIDHDNIPIYLVQLDISPCSRPRPITYAQNFAYYAFEQCSKNFPIMLNIMFMNLRNILLTGTKNNLTLLLE